MRPVSVRVRTLAVVAVLLALAAGGAAWAFLRFGLYDIAATEQHTRLVYGLMDYAMRRSVQARSAPLQVPELAAARRVESGAALYRGHCLQCHGAPGVAPEPLALGLTPAPANLVATARAWQPQEIFWVVKHGIKMTGMPAWEYRLRDEEIWDVVAFVRAMANMTTAEYAALAKRLPAHQHPAQGHGSAAGATPVAGAVLGDARAGKRAAQQHLCVTCHAIPGMVGANHHVGPPLAGMGTRTYIGGVVANTPENMVRWLKDPQALAPGSAMPALGLSDRDARDIAAFMYTLDAPK